MYYAFIWKYKLFLARENIVGGVMRRLVGLVGIIGVVTLISSSIGLAADHGSSVTALSPNVTVSNAVIQQKSAEADTTSRREVKER